MPSAPLPGPTAATPTETAADAPPRPAARPARGRRALRWVLGGLAALAALLLLAAAAVWWWLPTDEELARRAGDGAGDWLGVPVTVERLEWQLLPSPRVQLFGVRTEQEEPVTAGRIVADARWSDLLHRRLALTRLRLEDARVPQRSLSTFDVREAEEGTPRLPFTLADIPVERAEWSGVRWIGRTGRALDYRGSVDFDAQWRPRRAELEREGAQPLTRLRIEREGTEDRWKADVSAGGRTEQGTLRLQVFGARYRVTGAIDFSGVDVVALLGAFDRRSAVSGLARGHTDLIAEGADPAEAVRSLNTRTRFTVVRARLLTFDLERAVRSAGTHKGGTTALDSLSGEVRTEADAANGTIVRYSRLEATSGVLTATGDAVLQNRRVSGHVAVDLVDGVVGVPLEFGGTVDDPTLTLPAAALAGAAVGTVIAPGLGTALGARIGETVRRIFGGGGEDAAPPPRPAQRARPAR
ncbi:AsmA-like C-terminal region-containing protein [Paracidovorax konjaci]|uniref:AsmA-like C-terminal region n=1 Tax=Paracidovorax konjaci TaxID=32040 RepID=A0A1I1UZK5_9BURK|nr:AsmA-like C-terminal region-containing protein [Paracidovorax konjaci]SFD73470.1 hypothetical protein SAMN04489710_105248 [Paracidovorax konjaci]